jgi:(p)ppGpp synthase/HD superfamily hydrolase
MTPFTVRIHEALDFAAIHHRRQKRKDPDIAIPYVSHLFGVAYILAEYDFPEDVVVAGILHDFLEDVVQKERKPKLAEELRKRFGDTVFELVSFVTQQKRDGQGRKIDWHTRGKIYRERLCAASTPEGAKAISCADKIHNIESIFMALERLKGRENKMWGRMKATPDQQLQKFVSLHEDLGKNWRHPILDRLSGMIVRLKCGIPT